MNTLTLATDWPVVSYTYIRTTPGRLYVDHRSYGRWGLDFDFKIGPGVWS